MNKKFKNHHRVWFINFGGIGNGAMIMPILKCFENSKPSVEYYCTENDLFSVKWFLKEAKIKNLIGLTTSKWRRFNKENWTEILNFITKNRIDMIFNLRNEGPEYDKYYYEFQKNCKKFYKSINFHTLKFSNIKTRVRKKNLIQDIKTMLEKDGVDFSNYNQTWLQRLRNKVDSNEIGLCFASSQLNKCWSHEKWFTLAELLIQKGYRLVIFPGKDKLSNSNAKKNKR